MCVAQITSLRNLASSGEDPSVPLDPIEPVTSLVIPYTYTVFRR